MKIELPESVAAQLREPLTRCHPVPDRTPSVLAGQVFRGDWQSGVDKVFLHVCEIKPETARKIRKLIEKDRAS